MATVNRPHQSAWPITVTFLNITPRIHGETSAINIVLDENIFLNFKGFSNVRQLEALEQCKTLPRQLIRFQIIHKLLTLQFSSHKIPQINPESQVSKL